MVRWNMHTVQLGAKHYRAFMMILNIGKGFMRVDRWHVPCCATKSVFFLTTGHVFDRLSHTKHIDTICMKLSILYLWVAGQNFL